MKTRCAFCKWYTSFRNEALRWSALEGHVNDKHPAEWARLGETLKEIDGDIQVAEAVISVDSMD